MKPSVDDAYPVNAGATGSDDVVVVVVGGSGPVNDNTND